MDAGTVRENAPSNLAELTADIVSAYVAKNTVRPEGPDEPYQHGPFGSERRGFWLYADPRREAPSADVLEDLSRLRMVSPTNR
jgi:hypothetical protein